MSSAAVVIGALRVKPVSQYSCTRTGRANQCQGCPKTDQRLDFLHTRHEFQKFVVLKLTRLPFPHTQTTGFQVALKFLKNPNFLGLPKIPKKPSKNS